MEAIDSPAWRGPAHVNDFDLLLECILLLWMHFHALRINWWGLVLRLSFGILAWITFEPLPFRLEREHVPRGTLDSTLAAFSFHWPSENIAS